jgi:DNA polymerase III psi subunit
MEREKVGTVGWGLLTAGVIAWDLLAPETLSGAVDRALEHNRMKYVAIGAVAITAAHLLNGFERLGIEALDPFHHLLPERLE